MSAAGDPDHFLARNNLDALTDHTPAFSSGSFGGSPGYAEGSLMGIEPVPAFPGGVLDPPFFQEVNDGLWIRVLRRGQVEPVFEEESDGLQCIALGMADQPHRSALDPARGVDSRHGLAVGT